MARRSLLFALVASCALLLLLAQSVTPAAYTGPATLDPANPNNCLHEGVSFPIGKWTLGKGKCEEYFCSDMYGNLMISVHTCPLFQPPPGCVAREDSSPYPSCCTAMICS